MDNDNRTITDLSYFNLSTHSIHPFFDIMHELEFIGQLDKYCF